MGVGVTRLGVGDEVTGTSPWGLGWAWDLGQAGAEREPMWGEAEGLGKRGGRGPQRKVTQSAWMLREKPDQAGWSQRRPVGLERQDPGADPSWMRWAGRELTQVSGGCGGRHGPAAWGVAEARLGESGIPPPQRPEAPFSSNRNVHLCPAAGSGSPWNLISFTSLPPKGIFLLKS